MTPERVAPVNNYIREYEIKISNFEKRITEKLEKKSELENESIKMQNRFAEKLSLAGLPTNTNIEVIASYLAEYDLYNADKEKHQLLLEQYTEKKSAFDAIIDISNRLISKYLDGKVSYNFQEASFYLNQLYEKALDVKQKVEDEQNRQAEITQLQKQLTQVFGSLEQASEQFELLDFESLEHEISTINLKLISTVEQRDQINTQLGSLLSQMDIQKTSEELSNALQIKAQLISDLKIAHQKHSALINAYEIANTAAQIYMRENQPGVLKEASRIFTHATKNYWNSIELKIDDSKKQTPQIFVSNQTQTISATQLSRGTQEQLFLCLRIAVMNTYIKGKKIPVLLDDIAVNADRQRLEALAPVIGEIGQNHQVFYFTCHEATKDVLKTWANAKIIEI